MAKRFLWIYSRDITLDMRNYTIAFNFYLILSTRIAEIRFGRNRWRILDCHWSGNILPCTHLFFAWKAYARWRVLRHRCLANSLDYWSFCRFLKLATTGWTHVWSIVCYIDSRRLLILPFNDKTLKVFGYSFDNTFFRVHEIRWLHCFLCWLAYWCIHIFSRGKRLKELNFTEVFVAIEIVNIYLDILDVSVKMFFFFIVSTDILSMYLSKPVLNAFFLFFNDLSHFFEEISHYICSITVALFKLLLISLIFLQNFL